MRGVSLLICLLAVTACDLASPTDPTVPLDRQFTLAPGNAANVPGAGIGIRFDGVRGDSRCPTDVVCVHPGDATVGITVLPVGASPVAYELHTADRRSIVYGQFTIELVRLAPSPVSTRPIRPADYRATFRVTR